MTVAHDAATASAQWTSTPDPFTFVHTPAGTPRGVLVFIPKSGAGASFLEGITYGGVAMTIDLVNWYAEDTVTEPCSAFFGFLGASIPTGAQTVSINWAGSTSTNKVAVCVTVTAGADTEIAAVAKDEGDQANPSAALDTASIESLRYAVISSGQSASVTGWTLLSGMTAVSDVDFGSQVARVDRQTTASTGSFTIGWTVSSDDVAALYLAIKEGGTSVNPAAVASIAALPTPAILAESLVTPVAIPVVAALPTPIVQISAVVTPAAIAVVAALPTPSVIALANVAPAAVAVVAALPTPAILAAAIVTPTVIPVVVALPTPTVIGGAVGLVTPAVIAAGVTLPTPIPTVEALVTPAGLTLVVTIPTPTVGSPGLATPAGISLIVTLPTPGQTSGAITFWTPDPVDFVRVGPGDEPPWN